MIRKVRNNGSQMVKINLTDDDIAELTKAGLGRYVKYKWVFPNSVFEIIGRLGYRGTWIFRSMYDLRWYGTHTLEQFSPYDDYCPEVELRFTASNSAKNQ